MNLINRFYTIKHNKENTIILLIALAIFMFGVTYASVPLYRLFCQLTGFGGTPQIYNTISEQLTDIAQKEHYLKIKFNADISDNLPWIFQPCQQEIEVLVGETSLAFYKAYNPTKDSIIGIATYNISPQKAAIYFNKIQCFCFEEQRLKPGEFIEMPVFFFIDPEFSKDPKMIDVNTITLSYTFFKVET